MTDQTDVRPPCVFVSGQDAGRDALVHVNGWVACTVSWDGAGRDAWDGMGWDGQARMGWNGRYIMRFILLLIASTRIGTKNNM